MDDKDALFTDFHNDGKLYNVPILDYSLTSVEQHCLNDEVRDILQPAFKLIDSEYIMNTGSSAVAGRPFISDTFHITANKKVKLFYNK